MTFAFVRETHVDLLPFPKKTISRLKKLSVWYLEDIADLSAQELLRQRGFGLTPWFARPKAWQVLDGLMALTMWVLALLLVRHALAG